MLSQARPQEPLTTKVEASSSALLNNAGRWCDAELASPSTHQAVYTSQLLGESINTSPRASRALGPGSKSSSGILMYTQL